MDTISEPDPGPSEEPEDMYLDQRETSQRRVELKSLERLTSFIEDSGMASSTSWSEEEFSCSICLYMFNSPVSTPCGHNFCRNCITTYWDDQVRYTCPVCNELFNTRPVLQVNTLLSGVVDRFRRSVRVKEQPCVKPGEVPCDGCAGPKLKAVKSCLMCFTSYCHTHLEPHQTVPSLKRHQLVEPMDRLEDRVCHKHDRLLELFCQTEQVFVCQFCTETDHKSHPVVPLKEEYEAKTAQLGKIECEVQQMIQARQKKIKDIKDTVDRSKADTNKEIADGVQVLTSLKRSVEKCLNDHNQTVKEKLKSTEKEAEGLIKELEQEIKDLTNRRSEVKQLSHTEDHLHLLQTFRSLKDPPPTRDWTTVEVRPPSYVGTLRRALDQLEETLNMEMKKVPALRSSLHESLKLQTIVTVSIGLLSILLIFLCFNTPSPWKEGRERLLDELDELTLQGWMFYDKSFYLISTTEKSWKASREDCLQRNADLVVINSREEQRFVSRLIGGSWIGLSNRDTKWTFKWVDGTPMASSWRRGKPRNDGGAEDCVVAGEGGWSIEPCDRLHHWICEKVVDLDHLEAELNKEGSVMPTEEEVAPSITKFHSSTQVLPVGQTARYTCDAVGTPEPTIEWFHNGRPLERNGTDDQSEAWVERGFLFVRGVRYGVNTVLCMASNSAGTANHTAELLVFDVCELTLDPNTAHRVLSLSEDNRKVTLVEEYQSHPDHPERFDSYHQVLCKEALTGRCYWEVEWEGPLSIGVTYRGITRKGSGDDRVLGRNNKSWRLHYVDGGYMAQYDGIKTDIPLPAAGSTRVGVYLDRPAGTLSFYRVSPGVGGSSDTLTHIHTFQSTFTQEDLLPGFWLGTSVSLCQL